MGRGKKETENNHFHMNMILYKLPGKGTGQQGEGQFSLWKPLITTLTQNCKEQHQLFGHSLTGVCVATTVAKWYRMWGSACSLCAEEQSQLCKNPL